MSRILLVEEAPDLGAYEAGLLEDAGHVVLRCGGAPATGGACPGLRVGSCAVADSADLILFAASLFMPTRGRNYTGTHLLRAYRAHPVYGRTPMLVVTLGAPEDIGGPGPLEILPKFSEPSLIVAAVERLLAAGGDWAGGPEKSQPITGRTALLHIPVRFQDEGARGTRRQRRGIHATPHV